MIHGQRAARAEQQPVVQPPAIKVDADARSRRRHPVGADPHPPVPLGPQHALHPAEILTRQRQRSTHPDIGIAQQRLIIAGLQLQVGARRPQQRGMGLEPVLGAQIGVAVGGGHIGVAVAIFGTGPAQPQARALVDRQQPFDLYGAHAGARQMRCDRPGRRRAARALLRKLQRLPQNAHIDSGLLARGRGLAQVQPGRPGGGAIVRSQQRHAHRRLQREAGSLVDRMDLRLRRGAEAGQQRRAGDPPDHGRASAARPASATRSASGA